MALRSRLTKLEQKQGGGIRVVYQKDVEQSLKDKPLVNGEILIVLDDYVAEL